MPARQRELRPDRSARDLYGSELRRLRTEAGLSLARLAEILTYSKTHLGNIETADRMVPPQLSEKLDAALGTDGHFARLYPLVRREAFPNRYRRFMDLEAQARDIAEYAAHTVPGLLQTEAYARALLRAGNPEVSTDHLEEKLTARLARQERLRAEPPPRLWAILDEAVIRRPVGGTGTMCEQLAALLPRTDARHTTVQILPFSHGEHFCQGGALILLTLRDGAVLAYQEGIKSGQLIEDWEAVEERRQAYDLLRAYALSPRDSAALIESAMEEYGPCPRPPT
ncbi:helix-turn-helix transcriptional regulator [Streptomyces sp. NPDC002055]|uniref:helix-turn-helix domain-containing protein n=1 Tax=Streptomyces sp. NPDC002055 TaxID=3154534 RepID=UPI00332DF943